MSLYLHRKEKRNIWIEISGVICALLLAGSSFAALLSQLRLSWTPGTAFQGGLVSGLVCAWNRIADTLGSTHYIILPKYNGAGEAYGLFLSVVLILLIVIAWFLIRSRFTPGLLLFALPQILIAVFCGMYPKTGYILFSAAALGITLAVMKLRDGLAYAAVLAVVVSILTLLILTALSDTSLLTESGFGTSTVKEALSSVLYGTQDLGYGDLSIRERTVREGEALQVTMDEPDSLYLRGFIGCSYTGDHWEGLTDAAAYQARDLMDELEAEGFEAPGQLAQTGVLTYEDLEEQQITVRNTGADSRIIYTPYELTDRGSLSDLLTKGGSDFYTGRWFGRREYTCSVSDNLTSRWTDEAARLFTAALSTRDQAEAVSDYLRLESHFNAFVYQTYTQISQKDRELLASEIGSAGDQSRGHADYKKAIQAIRSYLEDQFIYTESLGARTETSSSELEDFFLSHKGYDTRFATAATLMFRYYGIPARYVEGYLITPEDAAAADAGGTVSVGRDRIHAWTEIYIDGVGFVPIEMTPEFYGMMEEADLSVGISNESLVQEFEQLYGTRETLEEEDDSESKADDGEAFRKVLLLILLVIVCAAGAVLLFFLLKALILAILAASARRKLFIRSDPKTAVAAIYGYMEERSLNPDEETRALGNRAAYSPHPISEEERSRMLGRLKQLIKDKKKHGR